MTSLLNKLRPVPSTLLKSNIILKKDVATKVTNLHKQMIRDILSTQFKIKERTAKSLTINDSKILEMPVERLVKVANILQVIFNVSYLKQQSFLYKICFFFHLGK